MFWWGGLVIRRWFLDRWRVFKAKLHVMLRYSLNRSCVEPTQDLCGEDNSPTTIPVQIGTPVSCVKSLDHYKPFASSLLLNPLLGDSTVVCFDCVSIVPKDALQRGRQVNSLLGALRTPEGVTLSISQTFPSCYQTVYVVQKIMSLVFPSRWTTGCDTWGPLKLTVAMIQDGSLLLSVDK